MPNNMKGYDFPQVIRSVFDVDKNCLRVCIVDGSPGEGGGIEVIIDHTEDSIRLGNGTDFLTSTYIGSKVGLDVNQINASVGIVGDSDTLAMGVSGTEQNYAFPVGTKWIRIHSRTNGKISYGYSSGQRNMTVDPGNWHPIKDIALTSITTLYFSSSKNGDTLEIEYWV